jgi:UDP-GlcNAc:undecaprenyl-phosphate/decaprenyl-phosphate GlcNAc-1-phosphate transferase
MQTVFIFFLSALICYFVTKRALTSTISKSVLDMPNHRSLHTTPTPRIGGIGIASSILVSAVIQQVFFESKPFVTAPLMIAFAALGALSIIDDTKPLAVKVRLPLHVFIVFGWALFSFYYIPLSLLQQVSIPMMLAIAITVVLGVTWCTNLFNFMDGSDGLAGSMAFVGLIAYSIACFQTQDATLMLVCVAAAASTFSFLCFNWPPAEIFLGDSGSIPLGFLTAAIGTLGVFQGNWPVDFPLMIFAMFWVDATYTLISRLVKGEKLAESHRNHWYQKAIRAGNSHLKVLWIHLICNATISSLALLSLNYPLRENLLTHALIMMSVASIAFGFGFWSESQYKAFESKQQKQSL